MKIGERSTELYLILSGRIKVVIQKNDSRKSI